MAVTNIGTFYQGQLITIVMQTQSTDTDDQKALVNDNDEYFGIYNSKVSTEKIILSTVDNTLKKEVADDGTVTVSGTLLPTKTKKMRGVYIVEMLIKSSDNNKAYPSENILSFSVEPRRLSEVIE